MVETTRDLRVMSFNVLNGRAGRARRWNWRKEAVAAAIRTFDPDLLSAQEVHDFQAEYLRAQLPDYQFLSPGRYERWTAGECVAVLFRSSRFEKLREGHFWLSDTPDLPGSRDWFSLTPRVVFWVQLRDVAHGGVPVFCFTVHLDPISTRARTRSAQLLRRRIVAEAGATPAIVAGDFNANAGRKAYRILLGTPDAGGLRLLDSYRCAHPVPARNEGTWHASRGVRLRRRIDWILHTPHFRTVSAAIDRAKRNGLYPSDHYPVTAVLRLAGGHGTARASADRHAG